MFKGKNGLKYISYFKKNDIILKSGKDGHFVKVIIKAKSSKMSYLGDEFRLSRIIRQRVTVNTH